MAAWDTKAGALTVSDPNVALPPGYPSSSAFQSYCSGICMECSYLNRGAYYLSQGDIYVSSALGIHNPYVLSPSLCGDMRLVNGIQLGLAMSYAVHMINSKQAPVSLNGVTLGNLIWDHCNIATRTFDLVSYTYTGTSTMSEADKRRFDPSKIMAWITDTTNAVTYMQDPIKALNLPLVSPIASSATLSNRENFPTYFRTVQGDLALSVAMTKLALSLNFRYVTVIYSADNYGESGVESFEAVATQEGLCVVQKMKMSNTNEATKIMDDISTGSSYVVILWTNGAHTSALFSTRATNLARYGNFAFFIPMPMMALAQGAGMGAAKTFMLNLKSSKINSYVDFIRNLPMEAIYTNPFLIEYYMVMMECDLPGFNK